MAPAHAIGRQARRGVRRLNRGVRYHGAMPIENARFAITPSSPTTTSTSRTRLHRASGDPADHRGQEAHAAKAALEPRSEDHERSLEVIPRPDGSRGAWAQ